MAMGKLFALGIGAISVGAAIGACGSDDGSGTGAASDPVQACLQFNAAFCDKIFGCFSKDELDLFQGAFGLNATDCRDKFNVECTPDRSNCSVGETYHADKAQSCIDQFKTFNCDDLKRDATAQPAACDQICTK